MTPERLEEIRTRAEAATPGPWVTYEPSCLEVGLPQERWRDPTGKTSYTDETICYMSAWLHSSFGVYAHDEMQNQRNAAFLAHARTDIPDLLTENDRLSAALAAAQQRAEAAERQVATLLTPARRFLDWLNFNIGDFLPEWALEDVSALRLEFARALEATAPPEPTAQEEE